MKKKKVSNKDFIAKATEIATEFGFDDPENAYWQCNVFSQAVLQAAIDYDIEDLTLILVEAEYQCDVGDVEAGYKGGHVLVKLGSYFYDWTIRQIDPDSSFPYKAKKLPKYFSYKNEVYSEDVLNDWEYYSKLITKLEG